jgi:predicted porin
MDTKAKLLIGAAAASLGLFSTGALAQSSVTLYGMVDLGVQYLTNANSKHDGVVGLQSGNVYPSNWGITGREDLGGGYAAVFKLENGINMANGANQSPTSFFNRSAYVGLDTPYGTATVGRQYKIMFDMSLYYDPTYQAQYSLLSAGLIPDGTTLSNAIKYKSITVGGLSGEAEYSFGQEDPGHMAAGTYTGLGVDYQFRSFSARVVYEQNARYDRRAGRHIVRTRQAIQCRSQAACRNGHALCRLSKRQRTTSDVAGRQHVLGRGLLPDNPRVRRIRRGGSLPDKR